MQGHLRTSGIASPKFEGGGKTFSMRTLTIGDYAKLEEFALSFRGNPFKQAAEACRELPPEATEERKAIWEAAQKAAVMPRVASKVETNQVAASLHGSGFFLYRATCDCNDPPPFSTPAEALEFLQGLSQEMQMELLLYCKVVTGEIDLGNLPGQTKGSLAKGTNPGNSTNGLPTT